MRTKNSSILGQRDILLLLAKLFNDHHVSYIVTGSIASSYYGYPRATHDIDFVVETPRVDISKIQNAFGRLDSNFLFDRDNFLEILENSSQFDIYHIESGIKIDIWVLGTDPFDNEKFRRKHFVSIDDIKIPFISAEDLILTKLLWCKEVESERHMRDCVGVFKVQGDKLDQEYIRTWAKKLGVEKLHTEVIEKDEY